MECKVNEIYVTSFCTQDLIDTLWNVKASRSPVVYAGTAGFNRYIVECKVKLTEAKNNLAERFNRYIVECKAYHSAAGCDVAPDLIDTLWNVKHMMSWLRQYEKGDLIDTLWNVK